MSGTLIGNDQVGHENFKVLSFIDMKRNATNFIQISNLSVRVRAESKIFGESSLNFVWSFVIFFTVSNVWSILSHKQITRWVLHLHNSFCLNFSGCNLGWMLIMQSQVSCQVIQLRVDSNYLSQSRCTASISALDHSRTLECIWLFSAINIFWLCIAFRVIASNWFLTTSKKCTK